VAVHGRGEGAEGLIPERAHRAGRVKGDTRHLPSISEKSSLRRRLLLKSSSFENDHMFSNLERWQSGRMYLTRNQAYCKVPWVRIPPSPPGCMKRRAFWRVFYFYIPKNLSKPILLGFAMGTNEGSMLVGCTNENLGSSSAARSQVLCCCCPPPYPHPPLSIWVPLRCPKQCSAQVEIKFRTLRDKRCRLCSCMSCRSIL
jgi:hypothetical protein